ncbi:hypothetical protein GCM10027610_136690 [Dactylosporangium cerinum]
MPKRIRIAVTIAATPVGPPSRAIKPGVIAGLLGSEFSSTRRYFAVALAGNRWHTATIGYGGVITHPGE